MRAACKAVPLICAQLTLRRQNFYSFVYLMWYRPFLPELGTKASPKVGEGTVQVACLSPQACLRPTRLPFPRPLSGQQWSGAQVLMGPSEGWAWHN